MIAAVLVKSGRDSKKKFSAREQWLLRLLLAVIVSSVVLLISTALYIYCTTTYQNSIVGIQARYFIPLLPLVMLIFYGNVVKNQYVVKAGIVITSVILLIGAILTIYQRLYGLIPLL